MVRICEEAYPPATPMPVPEIWKIGPAFPGVPRWPVPADFWLTRPAVGLAIRIICDAAAALAGWQLVILRFIARLDRSSRTARAVPRLARRR